MPELNLSGLPSTVPPTPPKETVEYLYVYPKGFILFRGRDPDEHIGDVVTATPDEINPNEVITVAAEDGDELVVLKVTRSGGFISGVEFVLAMSGSDPLDA